MSTFGSQSDASVSSAPFPGAANPPVCEIELFNGSAMDALRAVRGLEAPRLLPKPARRTATPRTAGPLERPLAQPLRLPKRVARGRCTCGACKVCEENARWDAVFNAKFADPTYYANRGVRVASPLSDFSR